MSGWHVLIFFFRIDLSNICEIYLEKVHLHAHRKAQAKNQSFIFCSFLVYLADLKLHDFAFSIKYEFIELSICR